MKATNVGLLSLTALLSLTVGSSADSGLGVSYLSESPIEIVHGDKRYTFSTPMAIYPDVKDRSNGPVWSGDGKPPIGVEEAVKVAKESLLKIYEVPANSRSLGTIHLCRLNAAHEQWCYIINFFGPKDEVLRGGYLPLVVIVKMDGSALLPTVEKIN